MAHNFYQQLGGEDQSFSAEAALVASAGNSIVRYSIHNDMIASMTPLSTAARTVWSRQTLLDLRDRFVSNKIDVAHFQNTFPLISPSAYYAAEDAGVPVVQSLRNYRLTCVNGLLFRDGHVCEDCLGKFAPWPGALHACYRSSRAASGVVAGMLAYHKLRRTYHEKVDVYIALTEFAKQKFIEAGLPAEKIVVKPNFVDPDPGIGAGSGSYALFVGRLSPEKGITTLLKAWRAVGSRLPLRIVGDGPMAGEVKRATQANGDVDWLGKKTTSEVYALMGDATVLVFPSESYETFGRVAVEAFARGTPVIASNIGAIAELVDSRRTGLLFSPGNATELAEAVDWLLTHPNEAAAMRQAARAEYEAKYTAESNYQHLMAIYERAIEVNRARHPR